MKRKLLSLLLCVSMTATLAAGCGSTANDDETTQANTTAPSESSEDTVAETADVTDAVDENDPIAALIAGTEGTVDLRVWAAEEDQDMVKDMLDAFAAEYPTITFDFSVGVESESTAKDTILTDPEAAADVFSFAGDQITELTNASVLQEVVLNKEAIVAALGGEDAGAVGAATIDGKLYAYPATADNGYFMFYNKEYFTDEDVLTLDQMMEVAADNGKQITMEISNGWYLLSYFLGAGFTMELGENGATILDWNGTSADGVNGTDVAQAILDIASNPGYVNLTDGEFATGIADGSIIAGVNGTWSATAAQEAWGDNYAATCLPTFTCSGQQYQMSSVAGYKMFGVNANSKWTGWAMLVAEWLTNEENQMTRFTLREAGPANVAAAASAEVQENPAISALAKQSQYAVVDGCEGANYWSPAETLGKIFVDGNPDGTDLQTLLDAFAEGAAQESTE